jgi:hypothetical protein
VFDMPQQPYERFVRNRRTSTTVVWAPHGRVSRIVEGTSLRVHTPLESRVEWLSSGDETVQCITSRDTTLGLWVAELETASLAAGARIRFRIFVAAPSGAEISEEHVVTVAAAPAAPPVRAAARERVRR